MAWERQNIPKVIIAVPYEVRATVEWAYRTLGPLVFTGVDFCIKTPKMCRGIPLPNARDELVHMMLDDKDATHILWVDSDSVCEKPNDPNEALRTLLSFNEPIVSGLYRAKQAVGFNYAAWMSAVDSTGKKGYLPIQQFSGNWLTVDVIGLGFCLVKREVYERIKEPWHPWVRGGSSEDFSFCEKARQAGYSIRVFTDVQVAHIGDLIVHVDGRITTLDV